MAIVPPRAPHLGAPHHQLYTVAIELVLADRARRVDVIEPIVILLQPIVVTLQD